MRWILVVLLIAACSEPRDREIRFDNNAEPYLPVGSCESATPIPGGSTECRSRDDCADGEVCARTVTDAYSGEDSAGATPDEACDCEPLVACESDADCQNEGEICRRYTMSSCCGPVYENYACRPPCTADTCPEGERCDVDGQCVLIGCDEPEYECRRLFVCDPTREGADAHGCVAQTCDLDGLECPGTNDVCEPDRSTAPNHCAPRRCEDGFDCGVNKICDAETDGHGCRIRPCEVDEDCECGACVTGGCQARVFICVDVDF